MRKPSLISSLSLMGLFMVALPVFAWLQWEPRNWVDKLMTRSGVGSVVHYREVNKSFPGLQFAGGSLHADALPPIDFDTLGVQPAFASLLTGKPALSLQLDAEGLRAGSVVAMAHDRIELSDISLHTDAARLSGLDARLTLLALSGTLNLQGQLNLQADNSLPLNGHLELDWIEPSSPLLSADIQRMHLSLHADDGQTGQWVWKLESHPQGPAGEGRIVTASPDPQQWGLSGTLKTAAGTPELVLSGTLGAPQWQ